jgi:hypothetical protein
MTRLRTGSRLSIRFSRTQSVQSVVYTYQQPFHAENGTAQLSREVGVHIVLGDSPIPLADVRA